MIHRNGWNSVYDGNISYRPRLCGHFYITESSIRKYNITKKNVLHIPTNLNLVIINTTNALILNADNAVRNQPPITFNTPETL